MVRVIGQQRVEGRGCAVVRIGRADGQPSHYSLVSCYVDDVDAHYEQAKAAGATILGEPEDQPYGDRSYRAVDPEGHKWFFATHVNDVDPSELTGS